MTPAPVLPALVALLGLSAVLTVVCPPSWQPWAQFLAAVPVAVATVVHARGRGRPATGPVPRRAAVDVVDLVAPDRSVVGCVEGDRVLTTAVELSAGAPVATEAGRDDPARFLGVRLPLSTVARQLDQGGVLLEGIDVVVHGRRAASGPDGQVYSALVGPLALVSHRRVYLLARFDPTRLALSAALESECSLEHVVAVATERLRRALVHHGVPCRVLDAADLAAIHLRAEEAAPDDGVGLVVRPGADPGAVSDALAPVSAAERTEVVRLRRVEGHRDTVDVATTMGLSGIGRDGLPSPVAGCRKLPTAAVLPVPGEPLPPMVAAYLVRHPIDALDGFSPPAHGCGQILGATRSGAACTVQLAGPHLRSVLLAARPVVCRQVAFRAVASGYRLAVVTDVPDRWRPLTAIADDARYRILAPTASDVGPAVDAVVWDVDEPLSEARIDALAGPGGPDAVPPTVIRVHAHHDPGRPTHPAPVARADLVLDGRIDGWISVEPRVGPAHRVSLVAGPGEEAYVGSLPTCDPTSTAEPAPAPATPAGAGPAATPGRT